MGITCSKSEEFVCWFVCLFECLFVSGMGWGQKVLYPSVRLARLWNKSRFEMHARLHTNKSKSFVLLGLLAIRR